MTIVWRDGVMNLVPRMARSFECAFLNLAVRFSYSLGRRRIIPRGGAGDGIAVMRDCWL